MNEILKSSGTDELWPTHRVNFISGTLSHLCSAWELIHYFPCSSSSSQRMLLHRRENNAHTWKGFLSLLPADSRHTGFFFFCLSDRVYNIRKKLWKEAFSRRKKELIGCPSKRISFDAVSCAIKIMHPSHSFPGEALIVLVPKDENTWLNKLYAWEPESKYATNLCQDEFMKGVNIWFNYEEHFPSTCSSRWTSSGGDVAKIPTKSDHHEFWRRNRMLWSC